MEMYNKPEETTIHATIEGFENKNFKRYFDEWNEFVSVRVDPVKMKKEEEKKDEQIHATEENAEQR